ncbi:DNA polymerase III subunit delta' [Rubellimicrobium aerolatum]|uniref:DNA polymerase III subunit delta n=1 Tax=Rubellimicrobium aerolatum TaxID=490979 RepID=A0ABW0SCF9_9RHOB|nr:DNA polymerase III subunit delta' [Rubellimicrobium aerolatum]MBP1806364.1 DNA polymerase-3 subunit delta' [Rubellimicrobium aerolatum]
MARAPASDAPAPEPDRRDGAPHPRESTALFGHAAAEQDILAAIASGKLHSGWLLSGPEGIGKATLAYRMAATLLAGDPSPATLGLPPDHPDARLLRSGAHPRLFVLRRGLDDRGNLRSVISVDEARRLRDFFGLSAADGGRRVVIVDAADELNPNAANAILKLLEEPPPRATLLLVAHQPARLLPTIRSRCRTLRLSPLKPSDLARALDAIGLATASPDRLAELASGSVGRAVTLEAGGGLDLYADLVALLATLPRLDRPRAIRLAESASARSEGRLDLLLDLLDLLLTRLARAGLQGPPPEAAPGESALLARLAPHDLAARAWADRQATASARARRGQAVNLDPAALLLDMLLQIEQTARTAAAA